MALKNLDYNAWQKFMFCHYIYPEYNISQISRKIKIYHSHCNDIIKLLEVKGWIKREMVGRSNVLSLTTDGMLVCDALCVIFKDSEFDKKIRKREK